MIDDFLECCGSMSSENIDGDPVILKPPPPNEDQVGDVLSFALDSPAFNTRGATSAPWGGEEVRLRNRKPEP